MLEMSEKLRFSDSIEIDIHKKISNMKFGESLDLNVKIETGEDRKRIRKAIEKSAKYNCMTLRLHWSKEDRTVKVTHEM